MERSAPSDSPFTTVLSERREESRFLVSLERPPVVLFRGRSAESGAGAVDVDAAGEES